LDCGRSEGPQQHKGRPSTQQHPQRIACFQLSNQINKDSVIRSDQQHKSVALKLVSCDQDTFLTCTPHRHNLIRSRKEQLASSATTKRPNQHHMNFVWPHGNPGERAAYSGQQRAAMPPINNQENKNAARKHQITIHKRHTKRQGIEERKCYRQQPQKPCVTRSPHKGICRWLAESV